MDDAAITGAEIVVRSLAEEGVEHVFGYPGGAVLYIYDEIFKQDRFQHILVRHEQAALHAADGYSRSSTKVGVALVTSGPGVTNAVTGLATAYMDSIPMVVISGQVPSHAIGQDAFQECDTVGITRPCVKHNFLVKDVRDLALTIKKAFHLARTGRPGPVLVDIPKDITTHKAVFDYSMPVEMRSYKPAEKGHLGQIKKAVQLLLAAERPMVYAGGGVILANASNELRAARRAARRAVHDDADGPRRLPGERSEVRRHAGHARHLRGEPVDAELRRAARGRRALRRSRDRQSGALRAEPAEDHPRRHRSVVDQQAREGRRADRRQPARGADRAERAARRGARQGAHRCARRREADRRHGGRRSTSGDGATA